MGCWCWSSLLGCGGDNDDGFGVVVCDWIGGSGSCVGGCGCSTCGGDDDGSSHDVINVFSPSWRFRSSWFSRCRPSITCRRCCVPLSSW